MLRASLLDPLSPLKEEAHGVVTTCPQLGMAVERGGDGPSIAQRRVLWG